MKSKNKIILLPVAILFLLGGCGKIGSNTIPDVTEQAEADTASKEQIDVDNTSKEQIESETEETTFGETEDHGDYDFSASNIINFEEAFSSFVIPDVDAMREVSHGPYQSDFPEEMQEALFAANNDIWDASVWMAYEPDCPVITRDVYDQYPFITEMLEAADLSSDFASPISAIDLDLDGEDEYVMTYSAGLGQIQAMSVMKLLDGKWQDIGYRCGPTTTAKYDILEWEGVYYLLEGNILLRYNGTEITSEEMPAPSQAPWWDRLEVNRQIVGYEEQLLYESGTAAEIDFLKNVDLLEPEQNGTLVKLHYLIWHSETVSLIAEQTWEQEQAGEVYEYVMLHFNDRYSYQDDKVLAIAHKTEGGQLEIDRVYYLAADLYITFEEK